MRQEDFDNWAKNVNIILKAQIMLDRMKKNKKFKRRDLKITECKIRFLRTKNFLNSPHFEGREELKDKAKEMLKEDWKRFLKIKS